MRIVACSLSLAAVVLFASAAGAQPALELPRPSPTAKIMQTVGLTEISVDYSSPRVNGRKIWGGLLPWGEVWRAGANAATKVTFSREVTVGGTAVPAGTYAFFVIPNKTGAWTLILSKNAQQFGAFSYKKEDDLVRVDARPQPIPMRERLAYSFSDFATQTQASLDLEWEKVRLSLPIKLDTEAQAEKNIAQFDENRWVPYNAAARYELEQGKHFDEGLKLVDKSIAIKEQWLNVWTKAQLLAAKGQYREAHALAVHADELGQKIPADNYFYKDDVKKAIADWKNK
jgi:hypothetical protein